MRTFLAAFAACLMLGALSQPAAAKLGADPGTPPDKSAPPLLPGKSPIREVVTGTPYCAPVRSTTTASSQDWLSSPVIQHTLRMLSQKVEETDGIYGYHVDETAGTIVLVHGSDVDVASTQAEMTQLLDSAEEAIAADNLRVATSDLSDLPPAQRRAIAADMLRLNLEAQRQPAADVTINLRSLCREDAPNLDAVQRSVESFEWLDQSMPESMQFAVQRDLVDGVIQVVVERDSLETRYLQDKLIDIYGSDVNVVVSPDHAMFAPDQVTARNWVPGRTFQAGRYADRSPHLGGVQFGTRNFGSGGGCTTGFAINLPNGGRALLTAGHCQIAIPLNDYVHSGVHSRSKTYNFLGSFYRSYWNDGWDVALIGSGGHKYRRTIYTDPDPGGSTERLVTGTWEAWPGAWVCMSGSFSGNVCAGKVKSQFSGCFRGGDAYRCGYAYTAERSDGRPLSQPGDSGGPVYIPHGRTGARAVGIISTGLGGTTTFLGSQAINKATGGWIADTCCDSDTW